MNNCFRHLTCAAMSDLGRKRTNNEDSYGVYPEYGLFCVADGMGGAADGEVASRAAVDAVADELKRFTPAKPLESESMALWIGQAINAASRWIYNRSEERGSKGTGTTFAGVYFDPADPGSALALHAGDSRVYKIHKRRIEQITGDHSAAALAGVKDENELNPMFRGMVMRAVGVQETVELDQTEFKVEEGDEVLLCTDGLTRMVKDKQICAIIRKSPDVESAASALVAAANENGGVDNVTAVLIHVGALPLPVADLERERPLISAKLDDREKETATGSAATGREASDCTRIYGSLTPTPSEAPSSDNEALIGDSTDEIGGGASVKNEQAEPECPDSAKRPNAEAAKKKTTKKRYKALWIGVPSVLALMLCAMAILRESGQTTGQVEFPPQQKTPQTPAASPAKPEVETKLSRAGAERRAAELAEAKRKEDERLAAERKAEEDRKEKARLAEAERKAAEIAEAKRKDDERLEAEPKAAEAERREQERLAAERKAAEERNEKERLVEAERRAAEIAEAKRKDDERLAAERKEKERLAEAERKERDRKAAEVAEAERKERERKAAEVAEAKRKEEERLAAERKAEAERSAIALLVDLARDRAVLNNYCAFMSKNREEEMRERVEKVGETAQRLASWADGKKDNDGTPVVDGAGAIEQFMGALAYILDKDSLIAVINDLESQLQNLNFTGRSSSDQYKKTEGLKNAFERIRDEASKMDNLKTNEDRLRLIALVKWIGKDLKNF